MATVLTVKSNQTKPRHALYPQQPALTPTPVKDMVSEEHTHAHAHAHISLDTSTIAIS